MQASTWDKIIWIVSFFAEASLLCTVLRHTLWKTAPIFTSFVIFQVVRATTLFAASHYGSKHSYFWIFWGFAVLDYVLQLGLIVELGRATLQSMEKRVRRVKKEVVAWALAAGLVALIVSLCSPTPSTMIDEWDTRVSLFTSLLTAWSYLVLSHLSNKWRIPRSKEVLTIGNGLVIWTVASLFRDGIYTATRWKADLPELDGMLMSVYVCVTIYWTVTLWTICGRAECATWTTSKRETSVHIGDKARRAS